jgi:hypothetical protein
VTSFRRVLYALLVVPALVQIGTFVRIVAARAAYPMDIEWLEGGELYQAFRFLHGQVLYGPPDQGYLPYLHPPGHFLALALVGRFAGVDYAMGRIVSIAFFTLAAAIVVREIAFASTSRAERWIAGIVGLAAATASFPVVSGVYDLIRNDTMALGLVLLGVALLGDGRVSRGRIVGAAAVFAVAAYTRLPYLFLSFAAGVFVMWRSRRNGILLLACTAALGAIGLGILQLTSKGWFWWLTVTVLTGHPVDRARFVSAAGSMLRFAPYLVAIPVVFLISSLRRRLTPRTVLACGLLAGALPAGLLPFAKMGGFDNDLIPIVFLAGPVMVLIVLNLVPERWRWIALAAASVYLAWRAYDPATFLPGAEQRARALRLNAFVAKLQGGVLIPDHPWLAIRNGRDVPQFHTMPYLDVIGAGMGEGLYRYVESSHAAWAIMDGREPFVRDVVLSFYDSPVPIEDAVSTMVGFPSAPRLLLARTKPRDKRDVHVVFDFESASYEGWSVNGDAFLSPPSAGRPSGQVGGIGFRGRGLADSYAPGRGDAATGELVSPPFILDRSHLSLLVGGGAQRATSVQLLIQGEVAFEATGTGSLVMEPRVWDVTAFAGQTAQIAILDHDQSPSGHILIDQIELFN